MVYNLIFVFQNRGFRSQKYRPKILTYLSVHRVMDLNACIENSRMSDLYAVLPSVLHSPQRTIIRSRNFML